MITSLLFLSSCTNNKIDSKNEEILTKLLELEEIDVNEASISRDTILVSIEVSSADEYDEQLIAWWGTIFGYSAALQGDYIAVIIENTVNNEPYTYISTNVYTIRDFEDSIITDADFWEETLVTASKPRTREVIRASGLPTETLTDERTITIPRTTTTKIIIWIIIIIISVAIIVTGIILAKKRKPKKHKPTKTQQAKHEHKKTEKQTKQKHKEHLKKINEKIKTGTKKLKEKTKEKTKTFRERMKQEPGK